ncbi:MAG TPA: tetratricopeptide repeat protein [Actinomycetota bacterium]|nr:tetratricopeptide repeat protein [Actinomycetota bacterium]
MYSRRLDEDRDSVFELFSRGIGLLSDGRPHQAAIPLARAKLLEPEKASIREALGRALFMSGRVGWARREFAKAVQIDPASDYAHFGLALACERTGERDRAIGHLKLAIAMRPGIEHYERALARLAG